MIIHSLQTPRLPRRDVCGDTRDGYTCTLAPHDSRIDHAQVGHVGEVPYTIAFWNYGHGTTRLDAVVVASPFPKDRVSS